jgi:NAD(P)H-hydrate epimerase
MKIVTVAEMVRIEQASDAAGHSYGAMMELAGRAVAAATVRHMHPWDREGGVLVLVGPGNNGGDGLVAARYLHLWTPQRPVSIYCWKRKPEGDDNYNAVRRLRLPMVHAEDDPDFEQLQELALGADVIVDALLGTGVARPIGGALADLLSAVRDGIARQQQEALADADLDPNEPSNALSAAQALRPIADFNFLHLPAFGPASLPQVVAVDCPSGLNCDTGVLDPASLVADLTVTFANPKVGHFVADGPAACGRLEVADIGVDPDLAGDVAVQLATPEFVRALLPARPVDGHKGAFGKALVVAGSVNYTGAAHLAGAAAYRAGAGLVTLGVIPSIHPILAAASLETTWLLLPEELGVVGPEAVKTLAEKAGDYDALLVGPGLTQEKEAVQFVQRLLGIGERRRASVGFVPSQTASSSRYESAAEPAADAGPSAGFLARGRAHASAADPDALRRLPWVIDADALNALAQSEHWQEHLPPRAILTPHPGEMARLCGCTTSAVQADRITLARARAAEWKAVIVLKGAFTVVAAPDPTGMVPNGRAVVLPFANPALATAGSGDVLAGAIAGALAQGLAPFDAAVVGGYLHGLAGELARQDLGDAGVVAGDLLIRLPLAMRQLRAA